MANQVDPGTMGGVAASGSASRQAAVAAQEEAALASGGTGQGAPAVYVRPPTPLPYPSYHGRRVSWVAVAIVTAGFLIGGLALIFGHGGPIWWLFWTGVGVAAIGFLICLATKTFDDWY